jgi:hypothetical protein
VFDRNPFVNSKASSQREPLSGQASPLMIEKNSAKPFDQLVGQGVGNPPTGRWWSSDSQIARLRWSIALLSSSIPQWRHHHETGKPAQPSS